MRRPWLVGLCCALAGLGWQLATVHFNYGGNQTALFSTGSQFPPPAALAGEHIYIFPNSPGYDGQFYHYVAHDPMGRNQSLRNSVDASYRYQRILLPALAWLLALGRTGWIDVSYVLSNLVFLFLGARWLAQILASLGIHPAYAVLYILVPASVIALDRLTVDLAFTSLALGFLRYAGSQSRWKLYIVLVAAALCRESGLVLALAASLPPLMGRRYRESLLWMSSLIPAAAWYALVSWRFGPSLGVPSLSLLGMIESVLKPAIYPWPPALAAGVYLLDYLQIGGQLAAILLALRHFPAGLRDPVRTACILWALAGLVLPRNVWVDCYASARVFSPLLLFQFLQSFSENQPIARFPLLLASPRIWLQVSPQALGIVRGLVAGL
jgi:hypothetical protein